MFSDVRVKCVVRPHRYHVRRRGLYVGQAFFPSTAANTRAITRRPPSGREKLRGHSLAWMAARARDHRGDMMTPLYARRRSTVRAGSCHE